MPLEIPSGPLRLGGKGGLRIKVSTAAFAPSSYGTVAAWYDGSRGLLDASDATISADGTAVKTWQDQSGNANHLVQSTVANQPLAKNSIQNSRRVVRFDGTNDTLLKAFTLAVPYTIAVVGVWRGAWSSGTQTMIGGGTGLPGQMYRDAATGIHVISGGTLNATLTDQTNWHVFIYVVNNASSVVSIDGVETTGNAGGNAAGGISVGGSATSGNIAPVDTGEVIAYSGALSGANRTALQAALKSRWGTP